MDGYTIGQLARAANVPVSTLRYYERNGLLKPDYRTGGNYRGYGDRSFERLRFIRAAQATGLSLRDVAELFGLADAAEPACDEVTTLIQKRLAEVRDRINELRQVERVLAATLDRCCKGADPDICVEIHRLGGIACTAGGKKKATRT